MYHYGGNNPVKYTDPTEEAIVVIPFIAPTVIAGGSKYAKDTRKILAKFNISVNDAVNGVFLDKSMHVGLHTKEYYKKIQMELQNLKTREQVIDKLADIAKRLEEECF